MPNHRLRNCEFDVEPIESAERSSTTDISRRHSYSTNRSSKVLYGENSQSMERHSRRYYRSSRSRSRTRSSSRGREHSSRRNRRRTPKHRRESRSRSKSNSGRHSHSHIRSKDQKDNKEHKDFKRHDCDDERNHHSNSSSRRSLPSSYNGGCNLPDTSRADVAANLPLSNLYNMNEESTTQYQPTKKNLTTQKQSPLPTNSTDSMEEPQMAYYNFDVNEPIDKERIHREVEEKLRQALAKEGKVYPPPKPEASHPVFANDGSFLEIFKKMQQQQQQQAGNASVHAVPPPVPALAVANSAAVPYLTAASMGKSAPPPPVVGRRKGGKILKTGMVAKPKIHNETPNDPKDFWSLYLAEVNKYKNTACESETGNRPLVK